MPFAATIAISGTICGVILTSFVCPIRCRNRDRSKAEGRLAGADLAAPPRYARDAVSRAFRDRVVALATELSRSKMAASDKPANVR